LLSSHPHSTAQTAVSGADKEARFNRQTEQNATNTEALTGRKEFGNKSSQRSFQTHKDIMIFARGE
jgi:hypothetical protein